MGKIVLMVCFFIVGNQMDNVGLNIEDLTNVCCLYFEVAYLNLIGWMAEYKIF